MSAILVWWGLRSAGRVAWWGAFALAVAWLLDSWKIIGAFYALIVTVPSGHYAANTENAVVLSYLFGRRELRVSDSAR